MGAASMSCCSLQMADGAEHDIEMLDKFRQSVKKKFKLNKQFLDNYFTADNDEERINIDHFGELCKELDMGVIGSDALRLHELLGRADTLTKAKILEEAGCVTHEKKVEHHHHKHCTDDLKKFKDFIRHKYKDPHECFDSVDQSSNDMIEPGEFMQFLRKSIGYPGDPEDVFRALDKNSDSKITWAEFRDQLGIGHHHKHANNAVDGLKDFRDFLKNKYKDPHDCFDSVDQSHNSVIEMDEFNTFLKDKVGYTGDIAAIFRALDKNKDAKVTWLEFKEQLGIGSGSHRSKKKKH